MRIITHKEALEIMASFHNITPSQLKFVLEEFDNGRGNVVINGIINQRYVLDDLNNKL